MEEQPTIQHGQGKTNGRQPTLKQALAVKNWVENGGNMRKALLKAGYSKAIADTPQKVFGSRTISPLISEREIDIPSLIGTLKELVHAKRLEHMDFPFGKTEEGEPFTEKHIREFLEEGCDAISIIRRRSGYRAYYFVPDSGVRSATLDMIFKLRGSYAPRRVVAANHDQHPGVWSLADLRRKMKENGLEIIQREAQAAQL